MLIRDVRFASEFGFQSWCSLETLTPVSVRDDWNMSSAFCAHRQHHPDGMFKYSTNIEPHAVNLRLQCVYICLVFCRKLTTR